jgi:hypothetical protein
MADGDKRLDLAATGGAATHSGVVESGLLLRSFASTPGPPAAGVSWDRPPPLNHGGPVPLATPVPGCRFLEASV